MKEHYLTPAPGTLLAPCMGRGRVRGACRLERAGSACRLLERTGADCRLEGRLEGAGSLLGLEAGGGARPRMLTTWEGLFQQRKVAKPCLQEFETLKKIILSAQFSLDLFKVFFPKAILI